LEDSQCMRLKKPILIWRKSFAGEGPLDAVECVCAGVCDKELSVVAAHGVWKDTAWQISRFEQLGWFPLRTSVAHKHTVILGTAPDIQLAFVTSDAV
jgi:hypothetical protein